MKHFRIQEKSTKASETSGEAEYYGFSHSTQAPYSASGESAAMPSESMNETYGMDDAADDTVLAEERETAAGEETATSSEENTLAETESGEEDLPLPSTETYETADEGENRRKNDERTEAGA